MARQSAIATLGGGLVELNETATKQGAVAGLTDVNQTVSGGTGGSSSVNASATQTIPAFGQTANTVLIDTSNTTSGAIPDFGQTANATLASDNASATEPVPDFTTTANAALLDSSSTTSIVPDFATSSSGTSSSTLPNNLDFYLEFPEGSGANTISVLGDQTYAALNGRSFTHPGVWATGKIGYGIYLEGTDACLKFGNTTHRWAAMSYTAWVNLAALPSAGSYGTIISRNNAGSVSQSSLYVDSAGKLYGKIVAAGGTITLNGSTALSVGDWHHVGFGYDSTSGLTLYVDGVADGNAAGIGPLDTTTTAATWAGQDPIVTTYGLNATIDGLGIWSRNLTSSEFSELNSDGNASVVYPWTRTTTVATSGAVISTASAAQTIPDFGESETASLGGAVPITASASQQVPDFNQSVNAVAIDSASAAHQVGTFSPAEQAQVLDATSAIEQIPDFAQTAGALIVLKLTATQAVPDFTSAASGVEKIVASAAQQVPDFTTITVVHDMIAASAAQQAPAFTSSATAGDVAKLAATQAVPNFTSSAAAQDLIGSSTTQQMDPPTQTATGANVLNASESQLIAAFGQTATISLAQPGLVGNQQVPDFGQGAAGKLVDTVNSTSAMSAFSQLVTAAAVVSESEAAQIPAFGSQNSMLGLLAQLSGAQQVPDFGGIETIHDPDTAIEAGQIPDFGQVATAALQRGSNTVQQVPDFVQAASGTLVDQVLATAGIPAFLQAAVSAVLVDGAAAQTMLDFSTRGRATEGVLDFRMAKHIDGYMLDAHFDGFP